MPRQVIIENPVINSAFEEPKRHFRFSDEGITNEIVESRRKSAYFVPVPRSRKRSQEGTLFDTEWTEDRIKENEFIGQIRSRVSLWRSRGRPEPPVPQLDSLITGRARKKKIALNKFANPQDAQLGHSLTKLIPGDAEKEDDTN
jgi:type III restriction enzyme